MFNKMKSKNKVKKFQQKLFDKNIIISAIYKCKIVYASKRLKRKFLREKTLIVMGVTTS